VLNKGNLTFIFTKLLDLIHPYQGGLQMSKEEKCKCQGMSRRHFLKCLSGAAASAIWLSSCDKETTTPDEPEEPTILSPRIRTTNPYVTTTGKPILVCVSGTDFSEMLQAGLSQLGGLSKLIGANEDVLIKPNCNAAEPYPGMSDVNSLVATIGEVQKVTNGTVSVADQGYEPAPGVYSYSKMDPLITTAGAELLVMSQTYLVKRSGWSLNTQDFKVYSTIYDAPIIINSCVLKRHHTAVHSCALKNNVGTVSGPGLISTRNHLHREALDFKETLAEIAFAVNPELNIVDARTVLTVTGPSYYSGVLVQANKIVLCGDIVATDMYCQELLTELDQDFAAESGSGVTGYAEALGLGTADLSQVEIIEISI
jgi:uncharacterized protein (DUF362 family)